MFNLIKESLKPKHLKKASLLVVLMLFLTFSGCSFNNQSSLTASSQVSSTSSLAVSTNLNSQDQVSLVAIEVNKLPTRLSFSPNEVVTTSGGELRVVYSDYSVRYISMNDNMIETNRLNISTLGNSSVTLKHQEGSIAKYVTYNVNIVPFVVNVTNVDLDIKSSDVLATQSVKLNPIITPLNGLVRDIKWSSSNPLIARVDNNGLVTPLNGGEVIITVTVNNLYSAASRLNILQDEIKEVVEDASQPVTLDPTADLTFALTTPSPSGTNIISTNQATSPKTVSINVANNTSSVIITATKLAGQNVALSGTNSTDVTAAGTTTAPTYTVNTSSVATNGGSKVFTLTVSESNKEDIVYNVSINVEPAIPPTANLTFNLTTPAASGSNTINVNQAASPKTISINVVNNTSSIVITAGKTNVQSVAVSGSNSGQVTAGGTATVPTYSINSSSIAANGGTHVFTLTVSESNKTNIIYNVTITVEDPILPTANLTFALTTPSPSGTNIISTNQATSPKTVSINVANNTSSVIITATKLAGQNVALSGTNSTDVTAAGTTTAPTYTVNTSSVATNGGSKVFTLTVSESNKEDIVYNVSINIEPAISPTANLTFNLTTPAASGSNTINVNQAASPKTISINVVNNTSSIVITAGKTNVQSVAISGSNSGQVTAGGTATAPTYSINSSSIAANGGTHVFTLTVSESNKTNIIYNVTITVEDPILPTADLTFALTTPSPSGTNIISTNQATSPKTVSINVANNTSSVIITATKLAGQNVALSGTNSTDVTAAGTTTAPTYTVNTSSVATNGGSKVFTLTVSESNKTNIIYNVTVNVKSILLNLDASNINSYPRSGTTWTNLANNNLNGTISGATFDYIDSGIFVFDGVNDYVVLGTSSTLKPANALTVEQWLYRETWNQSAIETALSNTDGGGYTIYVGSNNINFEVYINGAYRKITYSLAGQVGWFHVVGTFDGQFVRMHVNGVEVGSPIDLTTTRTITYNNTNATFIGAEAGGTSSTTPANSGGQETWYWNGKVALTRIYDYPLTTSSILQNYNDTKGRFIVYQNLVNYLDAGSTFSNLSSGTNWNSLVGTVDATITGGANYTLTTGLYFDGTTSKYARLPSVDNITNFSINNNYSIELWFNPQTGQSNVNESSLFEKWDEFNVSRYPYVLRYDQVQSRVLAAAYDGTNFPIAEFTGVTTNTWHQVVAVFNFTSLTPTLTLYHNGQLAPGQSGTVSLSNLKNAGGSISNTSSVGINHRLNVSNQPNLIPFKGSFGAIRIYNKALSADEINQNYNVTEPRFIDIVTTNLVINLDAGNTASYSGTGSTWTNLVNNTQYSIINGTFDSGNGGSIVFNGTTTYLSIGTPLSGGTNFTKEAWVNADVVSNARNILSSASNVFWNNESTLGGGVANSYSEVTSTNFPTLVWRHVVLTFDDTNDIMRLYINGVQVSEETEVTQSYISETERIGAHFFNGNPVSFWDGKIAQVRVYSAALTGAQVLQNFNSSRARYGQ
jgi:hypothetical protein